MRKEFENERPEVYAIRQEDEGWKISRRDFLKAAGIGAAVVGVSLNSRFVRPAYAAQDPETLCKNALAHGDAITNLLLSRDGKYLVSRDSNYLMKCWNFENYALLGSVEKAFSKSAPELMGTVDGEQAVISSEVAPTSYYKVPFDKKSSLTSLGAPVGSSTCLTMDDAENVYLVRSKTTVYRLTKASNYETEETLASLEQSVRSLCYLEGSKKLFVKQDNGFGILDPDSGAFTSFSGACDLYAILPGEARALMCTGSEYKVVSLIDGETIWSRDNSTLGSSPKVSGAMVSPDGSIGILGNSAHHLWQISMADGSVLKDRDCGTSSSEPLQMVIAGDGTKMAVAVGKSILFLSLPDFAIIGCPVDMSQSKDDVKGISYEHTDPVTGRTETITLPCGSPIPDGAICVCNCVAGSICTCDSHIVCPCVGNVCSCDNGCSCNNDGGHYWYPN